MDIDETAQTLIAYIKNSIAGTKEEYADALDLSRRMERGDESAVRPLFSLVEKVRSREAGRLPSLTFIPVDPKESGRVIAEISSMSKAVSAALDVAARSATGIRWLAFSVICGALALLVALLPFAVGYVSHDNYMIDPVIYVGAAVIPLSLAVVCFRMYQVRDGSLRRINEKRLALSFLDAAIDLTRKTPEAAPVLSHTLAMFMTHYEAESSPLNLADILPKLR